MDFASNEPIHGRYFAPGEKSGKPCVIRIGGNALHVSGSGVAHEFPYRGLEIAYSGNRQAQLVIEHGAAGARHSLYVERARLEPELRAQFNPDLDLALGQERARQRVRILGGGGMWVLIPAVFLLLALIAYFGVDSLVHWGVEKMPPSWEVELGKQAMASVLEEKEVIEDHALAEAIATITAPLLEHAEVGDYRFEFTVIRSDVVNAFALPGGQIVIHSELIHGCDGPEELAGVIAHEIQHVLKRHALHAMAESLKWRVAAQIILGDAGDMQRLVVDNAAGLIDLSYGEDSENEAYMEGAALLHRAEISAAGLERFLERLKREEGADPGGLDSFLATHPASSERVEQLRAWIAEHPIDTPREFAIDWRALRSATR